MSELLEDLDIPGMDEPALPAAPALKHGFELDRLCWPSGNPWYVYLRDPALPLDGNGWAPCVGTVTISAGPKAWQWWVDGYPYREPRSRGYADTIEEAAEMAWEAWQAAPGRTQKQKRGTR